MFSLRKVSLCEIHQFVDSSGMLAALAASTVVEEGAVRRLHEEFQTGFQNSVSVLVTRFSRMIRVSIVFCTISIAAFVCSTSTSTHSCSKSTITH